MPNRIIKDSICTSESLDGLSWFEECFFYRLIVNCDDYGRMDARPAVLKARLFPLKDRLSIKDVSSALVKLAAVGCVMLYECDSKPYLQLPTWEVHQTIRAKKSRYPSVDDGKALASNCKHMQANASKCSRNPIQSESESESESNPKGPRCALDVALDDFADFRRKIRKPLTDKARELTLRELEKLAPGDDAAKIEILNQSIQRGWQGVFALRDDNKAGKTAKTGETMPVGDDLDQIEKLLATGEGDGG